MKKTLFLLVALLITSFSFGDGVLLSWSPNDLQGMTKERFDNAKNWTVAEALQNNLDAATWPETYLIAVAANKRKDSIIDKLIEQLENGHVTKLQLTSRLIIWERILSNDIVFEGKGLQISDDLFSVAGRANWVLRNITRKNFGYVKPGASAAELKELKAKWADWRSGKNVDEYVDSYESKETGLKETHSLIALKALVHSLQPSEEKNIVTKNCLKLVYGLDEMPKDKSSPAIHCNPDTRTFVYLTRLVGDAKYDESKDYKWWANWLKENEQKLTWNKDKAIFQIRK